MSCGYVRTLGVFPDRGQDGSVFSTGLWQRHCAAVSEWAQSAHLHTGHVSPAGHGLWQDHPGTCTCTCSTLTCTCTCRWEHMGIYLPPLKMIWHLHVHVHVYFTANSEILVLLFFCCLLVKNFIESF